MTKSGFQSWCACLALFSSLPAAAGAAAAADTVVRKVAEPFDQVAWPNDAWVRAAGGSRLMDDVPPNSPPGKSLEIEVRFSGKGFEWFGVAPAEALVIPGDLKTVTLDYKLSDRRFPLIVKFQDGWGRREVGSTKLEWSVPAKDAERWASATFTVPADWVRPIAVAGFATHNWSAQSEAAKVRFGADQLTVETDLRDVDPSSGRLTTWKPDPQPKDPKTARDAPEPKQFFDGCGLFAADSSPKLALCSLAAMTSLLPNPEYVGSITAGAGTTGCVFRNGKELVAALWSIDEDDGPTVSFRARELRDWLGNCLPGLSAKLSLAPVYAVGLEPADVWYRQTAYELATPAVLPVTADDPVTPVVEIRNGRRTPLDCTLRLSVPPGWKAAQTEFTKRVPAGEVQPVRLPFEVPLSQPMGIHDALITVVEQGLEKPIPLRLLVQSGLVMEVSPLRGQPGPASIRVKLGNKSARPVEATLRLRLPASWSTSQPTVSVAALQPQEIRDLTCPLTWSTQWQPDESATVEFDAGGGQQIVRPIIPGRLSLTRVQGIRLDGISDDWPAASRLPVWVTGCTLGEADATIHLGWAPDAMYGLVEVPEAELQNPDPRNFWVGNCLELFLDTGDRKGDRPFARGDHQFWFVPLVAEKRVYCGQWKRADEIPETRYDLRTIEGVAIPKGRGYAMEFRLPIGELQAFQPRAGASLGVNLNLTIKGSQYTREVFWPAPKDANIATQPGLWGSLELRTPK